MRTEKQLEHIERLKRTWSQPALTRPRDVKPGTPTCSWWIKPNAFERGTLAAEQERMRCSGAGIQVTERVE